MTGEGFFTCLKAREDSFKIFLWRIQINLWSFHLSWLLTLDFLTLPLTGKSLVPPTPDSKPLLPSFYSPLSVPLFRGTSLPCLIYIPLLPLSTFHHLSHSIVYPRRFLPPLSVWSSQGIVVFAIEGNPLFKGLQYLAWPFIKFLITEIIVIEIAPIEEFGAGGNNSSI